MTYIFSDTRIYQIEIENPKIDDTIYKQCLYSPISQNLFIKFCPSYSHAN